MPSGWVSPLELFGEAHGRLSWEKWELNVLINKGQYFNEMLHRRYGADADPAKRLPRKLASERANLLQAMVVLSIPSVTFCERYGDVKHWAATAL